MSYKPCGYFRVSSTDTTENKLAVRKYRQMLKNEGIAKEAIFYDFASGGNVDRSSYQKMLLAIKQGKYNLVCVPVQSRLNRSVLNSALLLKHLAEFNTKLKICGSARIIDPNDATDKIFYHLNAVLDESKLAEASANSRSNHEYLRRNKMVNNVPFGYTIARGKPVLDIEPYLCLLDTKEIRSTAQILRELIDTILEKQSIPAAIKIMLARYGIPEHIRGQLRRRKTKQFDFKCDSLFEHRHQMKFTLSGVKGLISNPLLQGDLSYYRHSRDRDTIIYHDVYPKCAIVSRLEYRQLQALKTRPWKQTSQRDRFPYAGLIYCYHCKQRLKSRNGWKRSDGIRHKSYYCQNRPRGCEGPSIRQEAIERYVTGELISKYQQIALLAAEENRADESPEIKALRQQITQLEQIGTNEAIIKAIADIKSQIAQKQKEGLLKRTNKEDNLATLEAVFADPLYWQTLTNIEKWQINQLLIEKIEISTGGVEKLILSI